MRDGAFNLEALRNINFEWPERLHNPAAEKSKSESYVCTIQWVPLLNSKKCEYRLTPASLIAGVGRISLCRGPTITNVARVLAQMGPVETLRSPQVVSPLEKVTDAAGFPHRRARNAPARCECR
jgi:hypothetical protein